MCVAALAGGRRFSVSFAQLNEFAPGDLACYLEIGSVPSTAYAPTAFLGGKMIRTRRVCGVLSQGVLGPVTGPLSWMPEGVEPVLGMDVTQMLGVMKWVDAGEMAQYVDDDSRAPWPPMVPKTDEERIQNVRDPAEIFGGGKELVMTQKYDGTSTTFLRLGDVVGVCGRNHRLLKPTRSTAHYFEVYERLGMEAKLRAFGRDVAIQGEIIGPKINGNRHKRDECEFFAFNVFDIDSSRYLDYDAMQDVARELGLRTVPLVYRGPWQAEWTRAALLAMADAARYEGGHPAEGLVLKTNVAVGPRVSVKIISNRFLLKHEL